MNRFFLLVPVAAALIGGCGGTPPAPAAEPPLDAGQAASGKTGSLVVSQAGARPARTAWYLRIETSAAKTVDEIAFPREDIAFATHLPAGKYRVISWHRPCSGTCPASGEAGLGPLAEACGAQVDILAGEQVTASVRIARDGTCSVRT